MSLHTYIPQDRLRALAINSTLSDRTSGSALFADISGFTALTEGLRELLGTRQGAEELTKQLGNVYSALIAEIEKYNGSVIGFAGDSMMCWFNSVDDGQGAGISALSAAFGMQKAIKVSPELGLKVVITSGDARRFVVGDPEIQIIDVLAGDTVRRAGTGEHLAVRGEILVDEVTASLLGDLLSIRGWRVDEGGKRVALIESLLAGSEQLSIQPLAVDSLVTDYSALRPFLHRVVYERETSGQGSFLTEFRPCVALFVQFTGIDYDSDSAESELDMFVRDVQQIASRHGGTLLDITIGDKGSYVYINFGVLKTHEDDSRRAVRTALELRNKTELQLQMGITQGVMRVGAYGGETRKVFGALSDDVNLAARLMTTARENEILLSSHVHKAVMDQFSFEPRAPLAMKGKAEPLPVFAVTGERNQRAIRLQEPTYTLPMVGRTQELQVINDNLDLAEKSKGQVIGIVAEAGMGKSRLVAEVIRNARRKGYVGFGGACQSDGIHTPYLAWKSIWQAFFDVDPSAPLKKQIRSIKGEIEDHAPERLQAMPLLNVVLDLEIPDNDFTKTLEPQYRKSVLRALLEDCLRTASIDEPLLIVIEDMHWIDALSHGLLEELAKGLANCRVCFVLAYRPPQLARLETPRLEVMPNFTKIELHELNSAEAESAMRAKLAQLYPARGGALPSGLVDKLMVRSQGNPFFLEELLNYVRDRGLDPADLSRIELPDSLHTLILSRIDQLSEQEKTTLRVASIVGRLFRAKWLTGYYPELGPFTQVKAALDALETLDITPLDSPEPELAYLFKHIVTHEVTYESLPFATRARLHEQLARYLESILVEASQSAPKVYDSPLLDTITYHYLRSENKDKQIEYLLKAGDAAQKDYANTAALEYYGQLLALLEAEKDRIEIHLKRGQVLELIGKFDEAESDFRSALEMAEEGSTLKASTMVAQGKLFRDRGDYQTSLDWLAKAKKEFQVLEDKAGQAESHIEIGGTLWRIGEYSQAIEPLNDGLALAQELGDKLKIASALGNLGICAIYQSDYIKARALCEESLTLNREVRGRWGTAQSLNNLGVIAMDTGDYPTARTNYEEFLALRREMGDKSGIRIALCNLSNVAVAQGDYARARSLCEESLNLSRETDDKVGISVSLGNLGNVALVEGDYSLAHILFEESLSLCEEMDDKTFMAYAKHGLGMVDLAENRPNARKHVWDSLRLRQEIGEQVAQTSSLIAIALIALHEENPEFTTQLLGAVNSILNGLHAVIEPEMLTFHAQTLAAVKEQLGEAAFQSAWEEGSQWSLEEAVKRALEE